MGIFTLQPRLSVTLIELRPLRREDWAGIFAAASDPLIWEQHPVHDRYKEEIFRQYFESALESGGAFAVVDKATREIVGCTRYSNYNAANSEIEIGSTFLARSHWGGKYNGEMKRLMLDHAFRFVDTVVFLVGPENKRSRRAVEKIGGVLSGTRDISLNGKVIEHVVYALRKPAPCIDPA